MKKLFIKLAKILGFEIIDQNNFSSPTLNKELNEKHNNLKLEIENNQKNYEKLIDQTTDEISSFIEKANLEKLS